jgi:hypothetical protein
MLVHTSREQCKVFFYEGPRSRCYGHTAALMLIVQPCDVSDYFFFSFFHVMEHRWNEIDRGKPKYSEKNLSQCHFVHHKFHTDWPGIFFSVPLFSFDPFCTFKSFRPSSCHLRSILVLIQQTQHKHPCPRRDFFCLSGVFPLWSIFVLFKSFRPSCHFMFHATVLQQTQTSMPPAGFEPTILVSERPKTHALERTTTGIGYFTTVNST